VTAKEEQRLLRKLEGMVASSGAGKLGLTVREAAAASSIGETELRRRIDAGLIRVVRVGRRIVVPRRELERHLEAQTATMAEHRERKASR
jgi:excisionase family DNA binding protein